MNEEELAKLGIFSDNRNVLPNPERDNLDWDHYFMSIAEIVAKRSHDSQSKFGSILTKNNRIISVGFNGWPPGSPDKIIPNIRNFKNNFVNHSEENLIFNAAKEGISVQGGKLFVTGHPCSNCCRKLVTCGILDWVVGSKTYRQSSEEDQLMRKFWVENFNVQIKYLENENV